MPKRYRRERIRFGWLYWYRIWDNHLGRYISFCGYRTDAKRIAEALELLDFPYVDDYKRAIQLIENFKVGDLKEAIEIINNMKRILKRTCWFCHKELTNKEFMHAHLAMNKKSRLVCDACQQEESGK